MANWDSLKQKLRKPILFGTCGATGCLVAASVLGEIFLKLTQPPPLVQRQPQSVLLLIDTSGSMEGAKLAEVKSAAKDFVARQEGKGDRFAVMGFGSGVQVGSPLTNNNPTLYNAIDILRDGGGTNMALGMEAAMEELLKGSRRANQEGHNHHIILFTDGVPNSPSNTLAVGRTARNAGINLIAVGTGGAEVNFLSQLTGDEELVFYANAGNFNAAFRKAEESIYNPLIIESGEGGEEGLIYSTLSNLTGRELLEDYSWGYALLRNGSWTAIITMGISLALIIGQNRYQRRRPISLGEASVGITGSLMGGITAGISGQLVYTFFVRTTPILATGGKLLGWVILGTVLGFVMPKFILNLNRKRALQGGAIGGTVGGSSFLLITAVSGAVAGRLVGSAIVGFCIGVAIALIEILSKQNKLIVQWSSSNEQTEFLGGSRPVVLGSDYNTDIYLPASDYTPVTAKIFQDEEDKVIMEFDPEMASRKNMKILRQQLKSGDRRKLGDVLLEVKTFDS